MLCCAEVQLKVSRAGNLAKKVQQSRGCGVGHAFPVFYALYIRDEFYVFEGYRLCDSNQEVLCGENRGIIGYCDVLGSFAYELVWDHGGATQLPGVESAQNGGVLN